MLVAWGSGRVHKGSLGGDRVCLRGHGDGWTPPRLVTLILQALMARREGQVGSFFPQTDDSLPQAQAPPSHLHQASIGFQRG